MQDRDTVWQENVRLIETNGLWSFDVTGQGETAPRKFPVIAIGKEHFICENPANEFPKQIEYLKNRDTLNAKISGNGMEVLFEFVKNKQ